MFSSRDFVVLFCNPLTGSALATPGVFEVTLCVFVLMIFLRVQLASSTRAESDKQQLL